MAALKVLQNDHHDIRELFEAYERADALAEKEELAGRLIEELSVHASVEETVLFVIAHDRSPTLNTLIRRGAEAHQLIATTLTELERLLAMASASAERADRTDAIVRLLLDQVRTRVEEDNTHLFPALRRALSPTELKLVGALLITGRQSARRHPLRVAARAEAVIRLGDGAVAAPT